MLTILDRQMIVSYFKAYLITLVSLLGLFIIVDLFMNMEDFIQRDFEAIIRFVGIYYGYKSFQIFDRLCEVVVLLAGMFTVAWMQRNNELVPLLSAGVSTRRAVQPVLLCAFIMMGMVTLNQEFALPNVDIWLLENRQDPEGEKESLNVRASLDATTKIWMNARALVRKESMLKDVQINIPSSLARSQVILLAREAVYRPPQPDDKLSGGWHLKQATTSSNVANWPPELEQTLRPLENGEYFLYVRDIDLDSMTRVRNWYNYLPTWRLMRELDRPENTQHDFVALNFHTRLTRPLVGIILVLMGLSVILRDQNRNVFISAGLCLGLCAVFFATLFICQHLGLGTIPPAVAAWIPVFIYGPVSVLMYAEVHT